MYVHSLTDIKAILYDCKKQTGYKPTYVVLGKKTHDMVVSKASLSETQGCEFYKETLVSIEDVFVIVLENVHYNFEIGFNPSMYQRCEIA